jgi:hypothetical protein
MTYEASAHLFFTDGDQIKAGAKAVRIDKKLAYFKTIRGIEIGIFIESIHPGYFKKINTL